MVHQLKARDNAQRMRKMNHILAAEEVTDDDEDNEEQILQRVEKKTRSKPFYTEGITCDKYFKAIIDKGLPDSILRKKDKQKLIVEQKVVTR